MKNYYFLATFLPPLVFGERPSISFEDLKERLQSNLSSSDYKKVEVLFQLIDLGNIRALLLEEPIDPRGMLNEKELDEAILLKSFLPDYVFEFLDRFESPAERILNFAGLFARFFSEEVARQEGFLKKYLAFERQWRLVFTALRAKVLKRNLVRELQFEDLTDPFIVQMLAQKDADQYDPPAEYADLKHLLEECQGDPLKERLLFDRYRFQKIGEMVEGELFSIDVILAYTAQLSILDYRFELDKDKGKMILDTFKTS